MNGRCWSLLGSGSAMVDRELRQWSRWWERLLESELLLQSFWHLRNCLWHWDESPWLLIDSRCTRWAGGDHWCGSRRGERGVRPESL